MVVNRASGGEEPASVTIRPLVPRDQDATRRLILEGLGEHFGFIDEEINRDLEDITTSYAEALFLVAVRDASIIGTGAVIHASEGIAQVARMSTDRRYRRQGIAKAILAQLLDHSRAGGYRRAVVTTNDDWEDAIGFYKAHGFVEAGRALGGVLLVIDL